MDIENYGKLKKAGSLSSNSDVKTIQSGQTEGPLITAGQVNLKLARPLEDLFEKSNSQVEEAIKKTVQKVKENLGRDIDDKVMSKG